MKKILLPIAATLLSGATLASQIILIDFSNAQGSGGAGWNLITSQTEIVNLLDTGGTISGLSIGPFTAAGVEGANTNITVTSTHNANVLTADIPSWANASAVNDAFLLNSRPAIGGFSIAGLQSGYEYQISLAIFGQNASRFADYTFDVLNSATSLYRNVATFEDVNMRYGGEFSGQILSFSFSAGANEASLRILAETPDGNSNVAYFNAMQIVAIPEPSTMLLSLLALGTAVLLRRRK